MAGVEVRDVSADVSIIALVGPRTARVLATVGALGAGGDPRVASPFAEVAIAGAEAHVLLQSDRRALVLVAPDKADHVWRALAAAGRDEGLSCVGLEAVERFAMLDRLRMPATPSR
jgi:glycine cleavage system aminomethyltransferase T